ncbi:hypothetical protein [Bythopirellula polymerisocia]|uniref:hypothetical protein n=1 Tax=Bythopirellula polymerisocia TaxID=2528003 RepID=UPI0011B7B1CC|nr:hypothetical protein [Bythopirellula polymerisocia]
MLDSTGVSILQDCGPYSSSRTNQATALFAEFLAGLLTPTESIKKSSEIKKTEGRPETTLGEGDLTLLIEQGEGPPGEI